MRESPDAWMTVMLGFFGGAVLVYRLIYGSAW